MGEELSLKDSSILSNLKKSQNEYYPDNLNLSFFQSYLLATSIVSHFSTKK